MTATEPKLAVTVEELTEFLRDVYPGSMEAFVIEDLQPYSARLRMRVTRSQLRPGGTVSGPSMMALADLAMWVALLGVIGKVALSVTSHLDIDFLRKPAAADVLAETQLLKVGKRLAVGNVLMYSDGETEPCARASVTYAIPSTREQRRR